MPKDLKAKNHEIARMGLVLEVVACVYVAIMYFNLLSKCNADLDVCLLDPITYGYEKALDTIYMLQKMGTPIIFCSTKTRVEEEYFRIRLGMRDPFIVENGAAILIPKNHFR